MGIVQFPSATVTPKQAKIYAYQNSTASQGVYYTLVDSTNVRGVLTKVTMLTFNTANTNSYQNIRITIDGNVNTISNSTSGNVGIGLPHGTVTNDGYSGSYSFDYFCNLIFMNSIKVEIMQNATASLAIFGNVMYSQE